jgi:hypothetical protein
MKCIFIDSTAQTVTLSSYRDHAELRQLVGGYIESAKRWDNGDVLYVDEEGLLKPAATFFMIEGHMQPIAGNGAVVGREMTNERGDYTGTAAPASSPGGIASQVRFLTRAQADAWGRANASEPAIVVIARDGVEVLDTYGSLFARIPPADEDPHD